MLGQVDEIKMGDADGLPELHERGHRRRRLRRHHGLHRRARQERRRTPRSSRRRYDDSKGYFIEPTSSWPRIRISRDHGRGDLRPVLTLFVYEDAELDETLELCDTTSPYALTGAIFAQDRAGGDQMADRALRGTPATSTSTTSPPARWSASSPSAAAGPPAPTTRPALPEPGSLDLAAHRQGELRAAQALRLPLRRVERTSR
jgi:hypothetical protein